ncbi:MAG: aldehyde dehydrogenase family protein [Solirubrobacteraceae bacterium]
MALTSVHEEWTGNLFLNGDFRPPSGDGTLPVRDKATGETFATVGLAGVTDVNMAVAGAREAQTAWAAESYEVRAGLLRTAARLLADRAEDMIELIMRETGSIRGKAEYEVHAAGNELHEAAALTSRATGEILPSGSPTRMSIAERIPVGVVGVLTPWNFPLVLGMRVIAPALALGNAVVLKPSPETPLTGGLALAELLADAGAPSGLLSVLVGDQDIGEALVAHDGVSMVHFTGSSRVGRAIAREAGSRLKKVSLELGGNNALVVLDDTDVETAAMIGAWSAYHYQGQTCITAGRHIVARTLYEPYVEALARRAAAIAVGDTLREDVGLGPMINERQRDRAVRLLAESVALGARVVEGGRSDGPFFRPTVVVDVTAEMPLWREEIFAPIAPVMPVDSDAEALALTNDTEYGLVNAVLTGDPDRGLRFAQGVRSGMVHVNDATCLDEAHVPFGGLGASGLGGRSGGDSNLIEFTEQRWVSLQRGPVEYPY